MATNRMLGIQTASRKPHFSKMHYIAANQNMALRTSFSITDGSLFATPTALHVALELDLFAPSQAKAVPDFATHGFLTDAAVLENSNALDPILISITR